MSRLNMSRTPVREALNRLRAERLVIKMPTGGHVIATMSLDEAKELYSLREVLEGLVAREAAVNGCADQVDRMRVVIDQMTRLADYEDEIRRLGRVFHEALLEASGNQWASRILEQLRGQLDRYRFLAVGHSTERRQSAAAEHGRILRLVDERQADAAEATMREHVRASGRAMLQGLERQRTLEPAVGS